MIKRLLIFLKHLIIFIASIIILTGNFYFLQYLQTTYPENIIFMFWIGIIILSVCGYLAFNTVTKYSYRKHNGLSIFAEITSFLMWGFYFGFPTLYSRYDWAWSYANVQILHPAILIIGKILIIGGLIGTILSMIWLGINRTFGEEPSFLKSKGPYKYSRNPQLLSCLILIFGFLVIRPSLYNFVWLLLYLFLSNFMIKSEESRLKNLFGDKYQTYCSNTNRWITFKK